MERSRIQKLQVNINIGPNLRRLRNEHIMTQDQLVAKLNLLGINVNRSTYSRYETGELNIPVSTIVALRDIYKCSYDEFFKGFHI